MRREMIAVAAALALGGASAAYQYEISGFPPASAAVTTSSSCQVATGRGKAARPIASLEARGRTWLASIAQKLVTTPFFGLNLIFR